ncbi:MAG: DNA mismatch repair protein MutS [Alphaproteobacteria bacterium]|nr:DNA mismatch repair protein MutS [Alphaproteobacteria bacterium]
MTTPMFEQFQSLKALNPDAILFFRMGDFYETFFEDAEVAAAVLELTLTARNKGDPDAVPMAGVPHHAAASYIQRLVDAGYRVAIAEQVEDPATAKGLVRREVVRVVTPGVVLDPSSLQAREPNWLVAVAPPRSRAKGWGLAALDVSTGDLRLTSLDDANAVVGELHRLEPKEALLGPGLDEADAAALGAALRRHDALVSAVDAGAWDAAEAERALHRLLGVADLAGFGVQRGEPGLRAAGAVVRYATQRLGQELGNVHRVRTWRPGGFMALDDTTRRNLELTRTLIGGARKGSLLGLLDRTGSAMGSRLLREWLAFPLLDPVAIGYRLDAVTALLEAPSLRAGLRAALREVADIERIVARVTQGTAHARDLVGLRRSLGAVPDARACVATVPALVALLPRDLCTDVHDDLATWLVDDPPLALTDGGLVRPGAHAELDELTEFALEGRGIIAKVEEREREASGIPSLKIRHNKVFGYYIEITRAHLHRVPDHYLRKQTLTTAERYITPELKELEEKVLGADERRKALEYELFVAVRGRVEQAGARLAAVGRALAALDVFATLAELAESLRWCRPTVSDALVLDVRGGRHPVVEAFLDDEQFVPNDVHLEVGGRQLVVLTGPNMSGKSTIMRQTALIVLLAQIGSYVPADAATVGVVDRIFTRVGAADDLARGQSTFMVEMSETAAILHHASARSLVILDEIGRGTSTYDGLAIAWSVAEDLVDRIGCRALFATHYHELCELADERPVVVNQSVAVSEWGERILFLRRLQDGGASRSYGIQCARLAGLPRPVIRRAQQLLQHFEKHAPRNAAQQLSLFGGVPTPVAVEEAEVAPVDPLREALDALDPDAMSPRDALAAIYRLRDLR